MKSLSSHPTSVNGIQNTPRNKSLIAKLSKNKFVIVLIRRLCMSVKMTNKFPITARRNITEYKNIIHVPESIHGDALCALLRDLFTELDTMNEIFESTDVSVDACTPVSIIFFELWRSRRGLRSNWISFTLNKFTFWRTSQFGMIFGNNATFSASPIFNSDELSTKVLKL